MNINDIWGLKNIFSECFQVKGQVPVGEETFMTD